MRFSRDQRSITLRGPPRHVATSFPRTEFSNEVGHQAVTQEFNMHKHLLTDDSESTHSLLISIPEVSEEYVYFKWDRGSKIKSSAFSQRGRDSESLMHLMSLMYNSHVLMSAVWSYGVSSDPNFRQFGCEVKRKRYKNLLNFVGNTVNTAQIVW